jgi:hypothetical protein
MMGPLGVKSVWILPILFCVMMSPRKTKQKRDHLLVAREKARHRCRRLVIRTEEPVDIHPRCVAHPSFWPMATLVVLALVGCEDSALLGSRGAPQTGGSGGNPGALASGGNAGTLASGGNAGTLASGGNAGMLASGGNAGTLASGGSPSGGDGGNGGSVGQPPSSGGVVGSGGTSGGGVGGTTLVDAPNSHCAVRDTSIYNDVSLNNIVDCDGFTHRVSQNACAPRPLSGNVLPPSGQTDQCYRDTDCKGKANGHCTQSSSYGGRSGNDCSYDCLTDADCGNLGICDCRSDQCVPATCLTDSDCAAGKMCLRSFDGYNSSGVDTFSYDCQTSNDSCNISLGDCGSGYNCRWSGDHFACQPIPPTP